jgi:preprotein translocase subunit SecD
MRNVKPPKWSLMIVWVILFMVAFTVPGSCASVFQIRLVIDGDVLSKDADRMNLVFTNSTTGQTHVEVLWVSKRVLIDQNDIQTTRVATTTSSTSNVPGRPEIDITFTPKGRKKFAEVTRENINKQLAIVVDGQVIDAPIIRTEIPSGTVMVVGNFTRSEAMDLSKKINQALGK